jgi:hypothetical protein
MLDLAIPYALEMVIPWSGFLEKETEWNNVKGFTTPSSLPTI